MYGCRSIEWDAFDDIFMMSRADGFSDTQSPATIEALERIQHSVFADLSDDRRCATCEKGYSFETLIRRYGNTKCSDVRDRVFGFLGLASDGHLVEVDYSLEANVLWASVMDSYPARNPATFGRQLETCLELRTLYKRSDYGGEEDVDELREERRETLLKKLEREATDEEKAEIRRGLI